MKFEKVLVCHPTQQHSYRLATALNKIGILDSYCTTVYYKNGSLTKILTYFLKGKYKTKAKGRHCDELDDCIVKQFCEFRGLVKLLTMNISLFRPCHHYMKYKTADAFALKVADYAIKNKVDAVITYDDSSPLLFEILAKEAPSIVRIMDMSAANLHYMRDIYDKDTKLMPAFANRLHKENYRVWNTDVMDRAMREIQATQFFLAPSQFVKKSLMYSDVEEKQIFICPYGVDIEEFHGKVYEEIGDRPIHFVNIGGIKEIKGISYLLEAFKRIPKSIADLTIIGPADDQAEDLASYRGVANYTGSVLHSNIPDLLREADVFVFASLGEGLSLSTLEAAACGLPLIVTENSGVNDVMTDGKEGFIIPIQSVDAIVDKVIWFCNNRSKIETMGKAARRMASTFSWDEYHKRIGDLFKS